jgi:putative hydrolase of the HAD superfamily
MKKLNNEVKVIFFDAGGILFDTFHKQDERIRHLMTERGYQKIMVNTAIKKANQYEQHFFDGSKLITN